LATLSPPPSADMPISLIFVSEGFPYDLAPLDEPDLPSSGPLLVERWYKCLEKHPDRYFVSALLGIITRGAKIGCYCFRDSKQAEKIWQRCGKDAIFYIQVFGHRPPRKAPHRRLTACGRGRRWEKATGRVTRTAPKPANSLLSRRQEQKEWEGGSKELNAMRKGRKEGSAMGNCHTK